MKIIQTLSLADVLSWSNSVLPQATGYTVRVASDALPLEQVGELLVGVADGINLTFSSQHIPLATRDYALTVNGTLVSHQNYTISGNNFVFSKGCAPPPGSALTAEYYWLPAAGTVSSPPGGAASAQSIAARDPSQVAAINALESERSEYLAEESRLLGRTSVQGVDGLGDGPRRIANDDTSAGLRSAPRRLPSSLRMLQRQIIEQDEDGEGQRTLAEPLPKRKKSALDIIWR